MDPEFSLSDIPDTTTLNVDSSKHKRSLSKKGSFAHRKRPTRATIQHRSEEIDLLDSSEPEPLVKNDTILSQIDKDEVRIKDEENNLSPESSLRKNPVDARRVPGLLEGLRASKVLHKAKFRPTEPEPTDRTTPRPTLMATTLPASPDTTASLATPDTTASLATPHTSVFAGQPSPIPVLVLPLSVPNLSPLSKISSDKEGKGAWSTRKTDQSDGSEYFEVSTPVFQLPSTRVTRKSPPLDFKTDGANDSTASSLAVSNEMSSRVNMQNSQNISLKAVSQSLNTRNSSKDVRSELARIPTARSLPSSEKNSSVASLQYSQGIHVRVASETASSKKPLKDSTVLPLAEAPSSEVPNQSYSVTFTYNPESTPDPYTPKECQYQSTHSERRSSGASALGQTNALELNSFIDGSKNTSANNSSKRDSKYLTSLSSEVLQGSAKNSSNLNSDVEIFNTVDQNKLIGSSSDRLTKLQLDEISREMPKSTDGNSTSTSTVTVKRRAEEPFPFQHSMGIADHGSNYRQNSGQEDSPRIDNKQIDSVRSINNSGGSESGKCDRKNVFVSSTSAEVNKYDPAVIKFHTPGEITIECDLEHSIRGTKSGVGVQDNSRDSGGNLTGNRLTRAITQDISTVSGANLTGNQFPRASTQDISTSSRASLAGNRLTRASTQDINTASGANFTGNRLLRASTQDLRTVSRANFTENRFPTVPQYSTQDISTPSRASLAGNRLTSASTQNISRASGTNFTGNQFPRSSTQDISTPSGASLAGNRFLRASTQDLRTVSRANLTENRFPTVSTQDISTPSGANFTGNRLLRASTQDISTPSGASFAGNHLTSASTQDISTPSRASFAGNHLTSASIQDISRVNEANVTGNFFPTSSTQARAVATRKLATRHHTTDLHHGASVALPSDLQPPGDSIKQRKARRHTQEIYTSSFSMQLTGGWRHSRTDLGVHGVDSGVLPEKTFTFNFTPQTCSNQSLAISKETTSDQD